MAKAEQKLRKGLAELFKSKGSKTTTMESKKPNFLTRRTESFSKTKNLNRKPPAWMNVIEESVQVEGNKKKKKISVEPGKGKLNQETPQTRSKTSNGNKRTSKTSLKAQQFEQVPPKKCASREDCEPNGEIKQKPKSKKKNQKESETDMQCEHKNLKNVKSKEPIPSKMNPENGMNGSRELKQTRKETNKNKNKPHELNVKQNSKTNNVAQKRKATEPTEPRKTIDQSNTFKKPKIKKEKLPEKPVEQWQKVKTSFDESDSEYIPPADDDSNQSTQFDSDDDPNDIHYDLSESDNDYDYDCAFSDGFSFSSSEEYSSDVFDYSELDRDNECSDRDYERPKESVEDLIVHNGLAVKYNLESHHGVQFDETFEHSHILELPNQTTVKTIKQYEVYTVEKLRSLEDQYHEEMSRSQMIIKKSPRGDDCPELVPMESFEENDDNNDDDEGFKLWTSGITMDDEKFSEYGVEEDSENSSTSSHSDVNRKYLKGAGPSESDIDSDIVRNGEPLVKAFIIDASKENIQQESEQHYEDNNKNVEQETSLSEIIQKTSGTLSSSNVIITKAIIENYDEDTDLERELERRVNALKKQSTRSSEIHSKDRLRAEGGGFVEDLNLIEIINSEPDSMDTDLEKGNVEDSDVKMLFHHAGADVAINKRKPLFLTKFSNSLDSYYVLVLLKTPFYIYGTINVKLMAGSMEIYGYKLKAGENVTIHSPRGCSAVPLQPLPSSSASASSTVTEKEIISQLETLHDVAEFNWNNIKELLSTYDPMNDAILLLNRNEDAAKIKQILQEHVNENIFPAHIPLSRPFAHSEAMLDCMVNATAEYALQIPSQWLNITLKENSKFMFVGGKSVGKSTFLRYLLNKHLTEFPKILLIDLDIGQPEIFVPQTVSCTLLNKPLLGPGFFWQYRPDKAYAVGNTNVVSCAHAYMRAVIRLLEFCKSSTAYKNIPWLINTMGYNKGFGSELISVICSHLQPTDIIQLQSNKPINNFDVLFHPAIVSNMPRTIYDNPAYNSSHKYIPNHQLHILPSAILQESRYQREWQMSAKDMRYIMLLAHLSSILPDTGEWINLSKTFGHDLQQLKIVNLIDRTANERETLKSLECNLVYLCHVDDNGDSQEIDAPIESVGLGLVRGIDYMDNKIFIIPAIPIDKLCFINCLALGEMPLPASILTEQNPKMKHTIPFVQVMDDEATSRAVKQFFYRK